MTSPHMISGLPSVVVGPLQLRVLLYVWSLPEPKVTVHEVHQALNSQGRNILAYTTILTVMRNLARRRILEQQTESRRHIFVPLMTKEEYQQRALRAFVDDQFGGDDQPVRKLLQGRA